VQAQEAPSRGAKHTSKSREIEIDREQNGSTFVSHQVKLDDEEPVGRNFLLSNIVPRSNSTELIALVASSDPDIMYQAMKAPDKDKFIEAVEKGIWCHDPI
jgi:hypothetical protein